MVREIPSRKTMPSWEIKCGARAVHVMGDEGVAECLVPFCEGSAIPGIGVFGIPVDARRAMNQTSIEPSKRCRSSAR